MIKKFLHLFVFIGLTFLLPFTLFLTNIDTSAGIPVITGNGCIEENSDDEKINYYSIIISEDKDSEFEPGDKADPATDPEGKTGSDSGSESASGINQDTTGTESAEPAQQTSETSGSLNQKEQQMINLINEARKNAGLPALQINSKLTSAARAKSKDMVNNNYFSHTSPVYGDLSSLLKRFSISYRAAGENLAMNSNGSVTAAHNSLMGSTGHRANILNSRFSYVGVGIYTKNDGTHYYTQIFTGH
ncbi:MAG: CAP domain-containing protein [Dethiobacteria bacterium]